MSIPFPERGSVTRSNVKIYGEPRIHNSLLFDYNSFLHAV
jgi:hypothetical protein